MAQPSFSRRGNQGAWAQKLEKDAENLSIQYQTGSGAPSTGNQEHLIDQTGQLVPNFSKPMSHQYQTSAAPGVLSQQLQSKSTRQSKYDQASFQQSHGRRATQPPTTPHFNNEMSPSTFSNINSPELQSASGWENTQMNPFEFSFDAAVSPENSDYKVQPWWPPAAPSANNFLLQQQEQHQNLQHLHPKLQQHQTQNYVPVFSDPNASFDASDPATFGMNELMLNTQFQAAPISHPQQLQRQYNPNMQFSPRPQTPSSHRRQRSSRHPARTPSPSSANPSISRSARRGSRHSSASRSESRHRRSKSATTMPKTPIAHHTPSNSGSTAYKHGQRALSHHQQHHHHRQHSASENSHTAQRAPTRSTGPQRRTRHHSSPSQTSMDPTVAGSSHAGARNRDASVGFVNFTPSDSAKILTGVAPSGSSKTKARREKEAADRSRRLSQAAARAIIEAGGDVKALESEDIWGIDL